MASMDAAPPQPLYSLSPPKSCCVYPTCVFIFWEAPRVVTQGTEVESLTAQQRPPLLQWSYVVEWRTSNSHMKEATEVVTTSSHAVLEVLYPQETLQVCVIARGSVDGNVVTRVSTSCAVQPGLTCPLPWLHPRSMRCMCIFDALFFSSCGVHCVEAIPPSWNHVRAEMEFVRLLESRFSCAIVKATYEEPPYPITSTTVYYFVMCSRASVNPKDKLRHCDVRCLLERDQERKPCAVFCGAGEMGSSAALAAHLFISAIPPSSNELCSRVFCIAYGSPRRLLVEDYLVLASSPPFAGNFLHYTALLAPGDRLFDSTADIFNNDDHVGVSGASGPKEVRTAQHFNMPLGVRCGPVFCGTDGHVRLETRCSGTEVLSREECNETLDVSSHLSVLGQLVLERHHGCDASSMLLPAISSVKQTVENGATAVLSIEGVNLHFGPKMTCTSLCDRTISAASITMATPTRLTATISLLDLLTTRFFAPRRSPPRSVLVDLSLSTDLGYASFDEYRIVLPKGLSTLLFCSTRSGLPYQWIFGSPSDLIDGAISVEPLLTSSLAGESTVPSFVPFRSTSLLCDIAAVSELVGKRVVKKAETGLYNFIFGGATQGTKPISIGSIPMHEAILLKDALRRHAESNTRDLRELRSKLDPWKQRLLARLPLLRSEQYREKLFALLLLFDGLRPGTDATTVALEFLLFTRVLHYMRATENVFHLSHTSSLHTCMSFDTFYEHVLPLFLTPAEHSEEAAVDALHNISTLWIACLLYHLRTTYLFTHIVVVAGCAGSGCSTLCRVIAREKAPSQHSLVGTRQDRDIVIRRAKLNTLVDVVEAFTRGMGVTAIVCGELSDVAGKEFCELWCSLRHALRHRTAQRLFAFVTKIDELLGRNQLIRPILMANDGEIGSNKAAIAAIQGLQTQVASAACTEWGAGAEKRGGGAGLTGFVPVSFAPSVSLLRNSPLVESSGMSAEEFAKKLASISSNQVQRLLSGIVERVR